METRSTESTASSARTSRRSIFSYMGELKEEMKKVSWTTQEELKFCTKIVVGAVFLFGISIYVADLVIKGALDAVKALSHMVFG